MTKWGIDGIWLELKSKQNPGTGTSGSTSFSISLSELTGCKTSCILYIYLTFSLFKSFSSNTCIQYPWPPVWSIFHYLQRAPWCWCTQHWPKWSFHFFFRPQWVKETCVGTDWFRKWTGFTSMILLGSRRKQNVQKGKLWNKKYPEE